MTAQFRIRVGKTRGHRPRLQQQVAATFSRCAKPPSGPGGQDSLRLFLNGLHRFAGPLFESCKGRFVIAIVELNH